MVRESWEIEAQCRLEAAWGIPAHGNPPGRRVDVPERLRRLGELFAGGATGRGGGSFRDEPKARIPQDVVVGGGLASLTEA